VRRVALITGFCAGSGNTERLASALVNTGPYDAVAAFTFDQAIANPEMVATAVNGVDVITHPAGDLALRGTTPRELHALAPPLPTSVTSLVLRAGLVAARMHTPGIGIHTGRDAASTIKFDTSFMSSLARHGKTQVWQLRAIARYDGVRDTMQAQEAGIPSTLYYANSDAFFTLSPVRKEAAERAGVRVLHNHGEHNDPFIRPNVFVPSYFAQAASIRFPEAQLSQNPLIITSVTNNRPLLSQQATRDL